MFKSPYHLRTNGLNKTLKQEMTSQISPLRALYERDPGLPLESSIEVHSKPANMDSATWDSISNKCYPSFDKPLLLFLFLFVFLFLFMFPLLLFSLLFLLGGKCGVHVFLCATLLAHPF